MGGIFGKVKKQNFYEITDQDRAILSLKVQRDKLKAAYNRHENSIRKEKEMARKLLSEGRKENALLLLKRKKFTEILMIRIDVQLDKVERLVRDMETVQLNQDVFSSLKNGNEALQKLNEQFTIEDAEKIMEDSLEAQAYQQEISNILSSKLTSEDLKAVENEYEMLINEQLPKVPTHALPQADSETVAQSLKKEERIALEAT